LLNSLDEPSLDEPSLEKNEGQTLAAARPRRQPDDVFDALLEVCDYDRTELTAPARGQLNTATRHLRTLPGGPPSADEIRLRARRYRQRWPGVELTATALTKHWPALSRPPVATPTQRYF
jgi:hypothetical protein